MYIEPNSQVILLKDIPWNNNYEATMWFGDTIAQAYYILQPSKIVATFNKQSYVRPSGSLGGTIEVRELADNLYNVNYMAFQNTNFGSKWFYAFVTGVEYVNNKNTRITFEIDVMQTWLIGTENTPNDYTLNECFVEREHSATDEIGDNLIDEGLELGDYYYIDLGLCNGFDSDYVIVVASSFSSISLIDGEYKLNVADGAMYGNVYSGLKFTVFRNAESLNEWLRVVTEANYSEGIISMFMIPSDFVEYSDLSTNVTVYDAVNKKYDNISGYVPKNNKLFTFPYNMLCITDNMGNIGNYPYEYFKTPNCNFQITLGISCTPEAQIVPIGYKLNYESEVNPANFLERMTLSTFPQCAFTIDSYRAWVAQNATPMIVNNAVGAVIGGVSSAIATATGGVSRLQRRPASEGGGLESRRYRATGRDIAKSAIGGLVSVLPGIADALAQKHIASTLPPQNKGSQTGVINMENNIHGFSFYNAQIREEYAIIIDDYFQKYGYATKKVKIPNVNVREHWTYVKTIGCTITGSLPADDESTICSIFDSGITFFKDEASFKSQSSTINRPLSEVVVNG